MDMTLNLCSGITRLVDNVVVYEKAKEEHDQNFHNLMKVTKREGLCFNCTKCAVEQKEIHFFGAVFSINGLHQDSYKVDEIKSLPSPNNVAEIQKVLGIIKYMALFISGLSDLKATLREFHKKYSEYKWTSSHQKSLQQIKSVAGSINTSISQTFVNNGID